MVVRCRKRVPSTLTTVVCGRQKPPGPGRAPPFPDSAYWNGARTAMNASDRQQACAAQSNDPPEALQPRILAAAGRHDVAVSCTAHHLAGLARVHLRILTAPRQFLARPLYWVPEFRDGGGFEGRYRRRQLAEVRQGNCPLSSSLRPLPRLCGPRRLVWQVDPVFVGK